MTTPDHILPPPLQDTGPLETMAAPLIEAIARALCAAQGCRESESELDRCAFEAQVVVTSLEAAGYVIAPREVTEAVRYHRKTDGILRIEPDGRARFLTTWERICYFFGAKP